MLKPIILILSILISISYIYPQKTVTKSPSVLWYDIPAKEWTDAMPVGNGRLGAMIFGNTSIERIQVNEESLWGGSKINNNNPLALKYLPEIRQKILEGKVPEAYEMAEKYIAGIPGEIRSYQVLGNIYFYFKDTAGKISDYRRELDLSTGIASVSFKRGNNRIKYEIFSSAPDNVMIIKMKAGKPGGLDMDVSITRIRDAKIIAEKKSLVMNGQVIDEDDIKLGPGGKHMKFYAKLLPAKFNGRISVKDDTLLVLKGGTEVVFLFNGSTDYRIDSLNFDRSIDPVKMCNDILAKAEKKSFEALLNAHVNEHSNLFNRVSFTLNKDHSLDSIPTHKRLERFKTGLDDPGLIENYFQFGRYLLMGSSRKPAQLPANLQGIWNKDWWAPWSSDYHTNINIQMNYWPAEICNLSETTAPLIDFVEQLTKPGSVTAREMYGAKGWTMHHTTDVFGKTSVISGVYWGMFPMAGPWMTLPLWEHFEFTQDTAFLRNHAYPVMKGSAEFIRTFLFEDKEGHLVTAPTYSPENSYIDSVSGKEFKLTYAPTMDIQIIREVLTDCQKAAKILNIDSEYSDHLQEIKDKLPPVRIAANGTIMEWIKNYKEFETGHRHISHLFGLYPGTQITPETPAFFEAAKKTIERRLSNGGGHTGWSRAWIINFYARLLDGNECYKHLRALLEKSTLPSLLDTHPPFQIDGNFGGTAGIAEMLLQSYSGIIRILPALPDQWQYGSVKGLKARGNFTIDIEWENHILKTLKLVSNSGLPVSILYNGIKVEKKTKTGEILVFNDKLEQVN